MASRPSWATPARLTGEVAADQVIPIQVHLQMRDAAGAAARLESISDPDSAEYGHFLTDDEYNAAYAPTDADVAAVRAHLEASGLTVTHVPANHTYIFATGTAAQVGRTFSTKLGTYQVGADVRHAPITAPIVPTEIASRVSAVLGLSTSLQMSPRAVRTGGIRRDTVRPPSTLTPVQPPKAIGGTGTCSEWYGSTPDVYDPPYGNYGPLAWAPCGYTPAQIREAYGFTQSIRKGNDGTGVSIAVVDAYLSPTLVSDAQTYAAQNDPDYPLADAQLTTYQAPGTPSAPIEGWYAEQTLDVEAAHAMAPGANIVAVVAQSQSDQDLIAAVNAVIEKKLATIVSNSYETQSEDALTDALAWEALATQAGLKGVGLYFSSGDSGDESYGYYAPTLDFPGSLPTVTSVGGTALALGRTGQKLWETGWSDGYSYLEYIYPPPPDAGDDDGGFSDGGFGDDDGGGFGEDGGTTSPADAGTAPVDASVNGRPVGRRPLDTSADGGTGYGYVWYPAAPGAFAYGGGGGTSILFPQPSYQKGIVPAAIADQPGVPARVVPDVSMLGDPSTGFLIGQTGDGVPYSEFVIGGTSLSSPLFAATMALAQQKAKKSFGFANALLYKASKKGAFNDVTPLSTPQAVTVQYGLVITFDYELQTIHTTAGYDTITGVGSPNGATFLANVK